MQDASVYKRAGRSRWHVSYFCVKRMRRVCESTPWKVSDPTGHKHAMRFAAAKSQEAAAFHGVVKLEVWGSWAVRFLEDKYRSQQLTLQRYKLAWDWLQLFIEENALQHPAAVSYNHVLKFVQWRSQQRRHCGKCVQRNTALTDVKVWGVLFREAKRRGFCQENPCERLGLRRDPPAEKPEILDHEITLIRTLLEEKERHLPLLERWMGITFEIGIYHGVRLSETQIPMTSIDFARATIRVVAKGKNGVAKVYTNKIHPALLPKLVELKNAGATMTCRHPKMASKAFHTLFKGNEQLKHLTFHCTRVTVITRLARAGVPIQQAMAYVAHASESVHRIYQRLKAEDLTLCSAALTYGDGTGERPQSPDGKSTLS